MFASIVSRLKTYGITLSAESTEYLDFVFDYALMRKWVEQSQLEPEIINTSEVGL
ncbi:hypothetical protein KO489_01310 [Reinekea forsetii]|nr:hypothetical protein [Reinekea forsetii]